MSPFPQPITGVDHVEPVPVVSAPTLGGRTVLDTVRALTHFVS